MDVVDIVETVRGRLEGFGESLLSDMYLYMKT